MSSKKHRITIKKPKMTTNNMITWFVIVFNLFWFNRVAPIVGVEAFYICFVWPLWQYVLVPLLTARGHLSSGDSYHTDIIIIIPSSLPSGTMALVGTFLFPHCLLCFVSFCSYHWYHFTASSAQIDAFVVHFSKTSQKTQFCLQSADVLHLSWLRLWA